MCSIFDYLNPTETEVFYSALKPEHIAQLKELATKYDEAPLYDGFHYTASFPNGYGISIIKHRGSYGGDEDLFEIAVLKGNALCYDTEITDDVIGRLTSEEVIDYAKQIAELEGES